MTFPFYAGRRLRHARASRAALAQHGEGREKLIVLLNFPNNPTGYMPTEAEGQAIVAALAARRPRRGTKLVVLLDDAYFGLFYHLGGRVDDGVAVRAAREPAIRTCSRSSSTAPPRSCSCGACAAASSRFGPGRAEGAERGVREVLDAKVRGAIRGAVSNSPQLSQTLVEKALASSSIDAERKQKREMLRARAERGATRWRTRRASARAGRSIPSTAATSCA